MLKRFLQRLFSRFPSILSEAGQVPSSLTDSYNALLSTTLRNVQPRLRDNITRSNKVLAWLEGNGRTKRMNGGERVQIPLMYAHNTTADIYTAYGVLDTSPQDGISSAFFTWAQLSTSISISRLEERQNSGESRLLGLLESKTMQAEASAKQLLNNCIVSGKITTGASSSSGQFSARTGRLDSGALGPVPLPALVDANNSRAIAVGNINPNTYTFWRNQATSSTSTTFAGMKQELSQVYNDCTKGVMGNPDLGVWDQRTYEQYYNGLQSQERYVVDSPRVLDMLAGSEALKFRGATVVWDEVVPDVETNADIPDAIGTFTAGTAYFVNSQSLEYVVDTETDFITTGFVRPENQDARVAQILWMGALTTNNRRKNGVLYGIARNIVA